MVETDLKAKKSNLISSVDARLADKIRFKTRIVVYTLRRLCMRIAATSERIA